METLQDIQRRTGANAHTAIEIQSLTTDRDELLDALKQLVNVADLSEIGDWIGIDIARDAIARAEGK